jgi:4-hydroxysphinganine ceramide fatty acyl 2-hydroxylase
MLSAVILGTGLFVVGALGFSLLEYFIHSILSHRFKTPVSPIHWGHHQTPRAVFTSPLAWVPTAALLLLCLSLAIGLAWAACGVAGLVVGFWRYEYVHWRIHFRAPRNAAERLRRNHHLAHHFVRPKMYHGVTTRLWDRVFGTLPADWSADYARVDGYAPLQGESNFRALLNPSVLLGRLRAD